MTSRRSGASNRQRAVSPPGGRPHHLESVVHHFLSDNEDVKAEHGRRPTRSFVAGHGMTGLAGRAGRALREAGIPDEGIVLGEGGLASLEGLVRNGGAGLIAPADLVFCLPAGAAGGLAAAQVLGRFVRVLGSHRVDVLLEEEAPAASPGDIPSLRRLAGLVAPGVELGITRSGPGRWDEACVGLVRRFHGNHGGKAP